MRTVTDVERRARLGTRHALAVPVHDVEQAARAMTCLHATEPASVYLAAFARCRATRADIDDALYEQRSVVRQLAMRRTVFAFPRDLLPAVRGSAAARTATRLRARLAKEVVAAGIADDGASWIDAVSAEIVAALRERPATTRSLRTGLTELDRRVSGPGTTADGIPIAPRVLSMLAADGSIVRGRNDGAWKTSRPVWTLAEQWLGGDPGTLSPDEGYAELVRRWLRTFGPGTEDDMVWWLGATKSAVRRALADISAVEVRLEDGRPAWLRPDDLAVVTAPEPWAALLPALDPTTMGWRHRSFYLGDHVGRIFDRNGNGGPTAWWNGRIVGGWIQHDDGTVVVLPCETLPHDAQAALTGEADKLTRWLAGDVVRSIYQSPLARGG